MMMRRLLPLFWILASLAPAAEAELVIFTDGGFLKVEDFAIEGDRVRLNLPSGGGIMVSMLRVDRILEDEIVRVESEPSPEVPIFQLGFNATQPQPATPYGELIYTTAERHALNPALLAAVVRAESAFNPRAISHKGAQGLMQLMPATASRFGLDGAEVFEPAKNLNAGAKYLSWLSRRFDGDLPRVLAAYNAGEGTVDRYGGVPPYRETRGYLRRIFNELGLDSSPFASQ